MTVFMGSLSKDDFVRDEAFGAAQLDLNPAEVRSAADHVLAHVESVTLALVKLPRFDLALHEIADRLGVRRDDLRIGAWILEGGGVGCVGAGSLVGVIYG